MDASAEGRSPMVAPDAVLATDSSEVSGVESRRQLDDGPTGRLSSAWLRRMHQVVSSVLLVVGALLAYHGREIGLWGMIGPGAGFFPFCVGLVMAGTAIAWFVVATVQPVGEAPEESEPAPGGIGRVVSLSVYMILFVVFLERLGFNITMFVYLMLSSLVYGRDRLGLKVLVALLGSFGVYLLFEGLLRIPLPDSAIPFLRAWGL